MNLSTGAVELADWGAFPPVVQVDGLPPVYQLVTWSASLQRWVYLVARHTGRSLPPEVVEMTPADFARVHGLTKIGVPHADALGQVTGVRIPGATILGSHVSPSNGHVDPDRGI